MIALRAVAEEANDRGMFVLDDLHDAAFGAAVGAASLDARENAIAVHRIIQSIAADEKIAFDFRNGFIRDEEAVAIAMRDDSSRNEIWVVAAL